MGRVPMSIGTTRHCAMPVIPIDGDVSFRGGTEVARYNVMLDYLNQQGLYDVKNSDSRSNRTYERYNLRANLDFTIFKFIEARVDLGGRIERGKRPNIATDDLFYNMARYPSTFSEYGTMPSGRTIPELRSTTAIPWRRSMPWGGARPSRAYCRAISNWSRNSI